MLVLYEVIVHVYVSVCIYCMCLQCWGLSCLNQKHSFKCCLIFDYLQEHADWSVGTYKGQDTASQPTLTFNEREYRCLYAA